uniref:Uncharacterized protein n=1 Tax=Anguilla anguilla TaxID=7936 RepID=A0A0E9QC66_ANGAN
MKTCVGQFTCSGKLRMIVSSW